MTPLGPGEWKVTYDGRTVSLAPSIGNWSFPCRSHYWIDEGKVRWARVFSETEVAQVRQEARKRRAGYHHGERAELVGGLPGRVAQRGAGRFLWQLIRALGRVWRRGGGVSCRVPIAHADNWFGSELWLRHRTRGQPRLRRASRKLERF